MFERIAGDIEVSTGLCEPLSKLLVSPLISPIVVPYVITI